MQLHFKAFYLPLFLHRWIHTARDVLLLNFICLLEIYILSLRRSNNQAMTICKQAMRHLINNWRFKGNRTLFLCVRSNGHHNTELKSVKTQLVLKDSIIHVRPKLKLSMQNDLIFLINILFTALDPFGILKHFLRQTIMADVNVLLWFFHFNISLCLVLRNG
jgi:hypothetical protein